MAKLLNRATPEVIASRNSEGHPFVTVSERGFTFSIQLVIAAGITTESFIHFINDEDYWAFVVNDQPDGFQIMKDNNTIRLASRYLAKAFIKSTGRLNGERFFATKSKAEHNGCPLFEIYTRESVVEVIDREKKIKQQRKDILLTAWKRNNTPKY